jgi:hypothetical protein
MVNEVKKNAAMESLQRVLTAARWRALQVEPAPGVAEQACP